MVENRRETVVVASRVGVALVLLLVASGFAEAQPAAFTGLLTGHLGPASGGDVADWVVSAGGSLAVVDARGLGLEIDAAHARDFSTVLFDDSSITTVMLNFVALYPHEKFRPFLAVGAGVVRVRASFFPDQATNKVTDTAWNAGGGLLYMVNEALGLRGDVRYVRQFGQQETLPLGANGVLDFTRASIGVTFSWPVQ